METSIIKLSPELLELIGTGAANALAPFSREIFLLDVVVAGTTYCKQIQQISPQLTAGTVLKMIRQPQNEHDELAIGIYFENTRVGWVPMEHNMVISRLMDAGKAFFCRVETCKQINEWTKIKARIFMVE